MESIVAKPVERRVLTPAMYALFALLLIGALGWSLKERAIPDLFKFQLRRFSDNTVLLNSLLGALPALLSMLVGPAVGAWSDRTRSCLGRHIPFLMVCVPLISLSLIGLAYSQRLGNWLWSLAQSAPQEQSTFVLACMCVCWTAYSLFTIIGNALFIGMINDVVPRAIIGRFFGVLRIVSLAVGGIFFYSYFTKELTEAVQSIILSVALAYFLCFVTVCVGVSALRRVTRAPDGMPADGVLAGEGVGDTAATPWKFPLLFIAVALGAICVLPANINSYHAIGQFHVDYHEYGRTVAAGYAMSILLALPIGWLADRYHPVWIGFVAMLLYACCMLAAWWLVIGPLSYLLWLFVHVVLAGAFLTGTASLLPVMLPRQQFSSLAALSASLTALLTVLFTMLIGYLLDRNGHDYRLVFLAAGSVGLIAAWCWYRLLLRYRRH